MAEYQELKEKAELEPAVGFLPEVEHIKDPEFTRKGLGVIATEAGYVEAPELRTQTADANVDGQTP